MDWRRWSEFWVLMGLMLAGSMAWALENLPTSNLRLGVMIIFLSIVCITLLANVYLTNRREESDKEDGKSVRYNKRTDIAAAIDSVANEQRAYREQRDTQDRRTRLRDALTIIGLFFAAGFAALQWATLEKTDQTLRLQQRAWIAMRGLITPENFKTRWISTLKFRFGLKMLEENRPSK